MDFKKKMSVSILTVVGIFIIGFLLGAIILTGYINFSEQASTPDEISAPTWIPGKYWKYSFKTPYIEDAISQMVVATEDEENYQVGVISRLDAQRHAVLNYNPMLGRITTENLEVFEKGTPQPLFSFPLKKDKEWSFSMFDIEEFNAKVTSIRSVKMSDDERTVIVNIQAEAASGDRLIYSYDKSAKWVNTLVWEDSSGNPQLEMTLVSHGQGFEGDVFFVRGVDIIKEYYTAPELTIFNSYVGSHDDWGPFDSLVYHFVISTEDNSGGTLILRDPTTLSETMRRVFGPNIFESSLGTIPSDSEQLGIEVSLFGNAYLDLRIAGGIEYVWVV
jgi:hypothetical protein